MVKNFTFLAWIVCLLIAVAYPGNQQPESASNIYGYKVKSKTDSAQSTPSITGYDTHNDSALAYADDPVSNPYEQIIGVPGAPLTDQYAANQIRDFKAADPGEGLFFMNAPVANSSGNALLNFNLKLPEGRLGMQPALSIQYNNEGGSTWLGYGWNMTIPAVGIETRWGVPRYDAALETEVYTLNGEQLAPLNIRTDLVARTTEKRFYPRIEGAFNKIIRHGNSPATYWWEVTDKTGTRSFYGGKPGTGVVNNAVLKDDLGNIGYWGLVETRDLHDNFVKYVYETVMDPGVSGGSVPGSQLYPKQILYTGSGTTDGPYKIDFVRDRQLGEARRKDISIDARLGFKLVSTDLLRKVKISFNGAPVRSYEYSYEEGAFYKSLLKSISELDAADSLFYSYSLDYYDDVNKRAYKPANVATYWTIGGDGIQGDLINPIPGFTSGGSALSASKAVSWSSGVAATVGTIFSEVWSKSMSVGGFLNYGEDKEEGMVSMIDINGDGLPDKVFKKGGNLFYRANLGAATRSFSDSRPITGASDFSNSVSKNFAAGVQVVPPKSFLGYSNTGTTTITSVYFSDFNGDGLMDIAANGKVLFNHLNAQGNPEFNAYSTLTPNPILTGSISGSFLGVDTALQSRQERDFPLHDIIRLWEAPLEGFVAITAPVQLVDIPQSGIFNAQKDGVRVSIQSGDTLVWSALIGAADHTIKTPVNVNHLYVQKGQRIYFRVQSVYNGDDDLVSWDPVIEYTTPVVPSSDVHHKSSNYYQASADFILHSTAATNIGKDGTIVIDGPFDKQITSDSVTLLITRKRNNIVTTIFEKAYAGRDLASGNLAMPGQFQVLTLDELYFSLVSRSYIDRSALQWKPHYAYTSFTDATPVITGDGNPTVQGYPVPDNSNYNNWLIAAPPVAAAQQDSVVLWPQVAANNGAYGTLWFTVKGTDTIYARRRIFIANGAMDTSMDSIRLVRKANEPLFLEYATDTFEFAMNLQTPVVEMYKDSFFLTAGSPDTLHLKDTLLASLYTNPARSQLGPLFRGWGQFAFKGDPTNGILDQRKLSLDNINTLPNDPANYPDSASLGGLGSLPNPAMADLVVLAPNPLKQSWVGYDTSVYVNNGFMSSARLWMHDVSVDSLMAGQSAAAVNKKSETITNSFSGGISVGLDGGLGTSFATTRVQLDMMDMNGDLYPDVLNDESMQYTLPNGGLGTAVIQQSVGQSENKGWSAGLSGGGEYQQASTEGANKGNGAKAAQKTAKASPGISGSINTNNDQSVAAWVDMNGDGLMDRVYNNGAVSLNMGYRFAAPEQWGMAGIDENFSASVGAGLGISLSAGSFQAGFGLSRTEGDNRLLLNDINGDGLPDELVLKGTTLVVRLNTGNGFGPAFNWNGFTAINYNISTGESLNTAVTLSFPVAIIFIKFCINPSANGGHGVTRQEDVIMDIDGDGYADMLHSGNDGELKATSSTIGRTNMLRTVGGTIPGYFTMDYERLGNTYDMPQSKWVLKNLEVFDGVPGDGIDTTRQQFSYEGGYQDRREREFLGFRKVVSRELNTANNNIVYRSHVQNFLNTSYYYKGLLASEWLEDAAGKRYTQTNNLYELHPVQNDVQFPALKQTEKLFYEGAAIAGVRTATQFEYDALGNMTRISDAGDGSQQDMLITDITYHNNDNLYIKAIPSGIEVNTAGGIKRKRTTAIDGTGKVTRVREFLADGTFADTDMEYDSYGNMTKQTRPANYKGERMWNRYEYDGTVHNYVTKVTDAFGYTSSSSTWDYRFGALTGTVSRNNEPMRYTLDNRGRLVKLTGPYELAAGKPYTIAFDYNTAAATPYAVTRHYDPEYNADINIVSFGDGLGRVVQVKKQISTFKGKGIPDEVKMVVSGSVLFDAFGREEYYYYPITEPMGAGMVTLNTGTGNFTSVVSYDVQDRPLKTVLADGATSTTVYTAANGLFSTVVTDELKNRKETLSDVRDRERFFKEFGPDGTITTRFDYNALSELLKEVDTKGNVLAFTYDNLGRKTSVQHPDAGLTELTYDLAGNLLKKVNARVRKEIPNGAIQYQYEYERLTDIDYPYNYQNKVKYTYGKAGTGNKAGRLILQQDASGGQEFFYGLQGEVTKVIRTVLVSPVFATTYVSEQQFDTWRRLKKLTYPDGEEVRYHYNQAGGLYSMEGVKQGSTYKYVDQLGYDEFEQRTYLRYGNGTENLYQYDSLRRRLTLLKALTLTGRAMMNNTYSYDAVNNVTGIVNNVQAKNGLPGGYAKQDYHYDNLYRLDSASAQYQGPKGPSGYGARFWYDNLNNMVHKKMNGPAKDKSYDNVYVYGGAAPHRAVQIGDNKYQYDANGNQKGYGDVENFWDEENRLTGVVNKGVLSVYTYDADGIRVISSSGGLQGLWVNGTPAGTVKHNDNYSIAVSPYIVCKSGSYTKHYYIDGQRIVTKLGHGTFTNIAFPQPGLTAGGVDYAKRVALMEQARLAYYATLGVSPGPPTDKNYWARPENSGIPAPVFIDSTASDVPMGWPGNTTPPPIGPPVFVGTMPSNDSVKAGYGFQDAGHFYEDAQFFYHSDHVGSTSYISNALGEASGHIDYAPVGDIYAEEYTSTYQTPYLFHAKSRDEGTGYFYYGDQYYEPLLSQWLSVADPLGERSLQPMARYATVAGSDDDSGGGYSINAGAAAITEGISFSGGDGKLGGSDDGEEKKSDKKGTPKLNSGQAGPQAGAGMSKPSVTRYNAKSQTPNNLRRGYRQARNALQINGNAFSQGANARRRESISK